MKIAITQSKKIVITKIKEKQINQIDFICNKVLFIIFLLSDYLSD